jgi:hypothetical protein
MKRCQVYSLVSVVVLVALAFTARAQATTAVGTAQPTMPLGQYMSVTMTIDDTKTRFELTGPDFSWFAFGFDTTTMQGYSLIIEGIDANRTAVEQNLVGIGNPGSPQPTQNISIISTVHQQALDLTTIVIERLNDTGNSDDPILSPFISSLDFIAAYNGNSSPANPDPTLSYHGSTGRGFGTIEFTIIPEPTAATLLLAAAGVGTLYRRRAS